MPVVLPLVVVTVTETGALDVTVDGDPLDAPAPGQAWTRSRFGELLDTITDNRRITVRIEVHETDGSQFTDIIQAVRRPAPAEPEPTEAKPPKKKGKPRQQVEIQAEGFLPGEDIAVAVVRATVEADEHGQILLDRSDLRGAAEVLLYGRASGTIHLEAAS